MFDYIIVFYFVSLFIFPKFWKVNYPLFFLLIVVSFLAFTFVAYVNFYYIFPSLGGKNYYLVFSLYDIIITNLYSFTLTVVPAAGYFFVNLGQEKLRIQNEREKTLLVKELNFLKNQFNSHVTFNFLNYCYSNIHEISKETAEAIELFSNMLRYSLQTHPDERVSLTKEIEYIQNFISLQRLLTSKIWVEFVCDGDVRNKLILPRILITFIENAFKHGEFSYASHPIRIHLSASEASVRLKVFNRKSNRKCREATGIGHKNVIQLLELYYAMQYELKINDDLENYACELNLKFTV